ncbi:MAG: UDP-N-acetylglucosamine 4,6-dehydratase (inverting) [Nitrospiraceae bacterium]|nr:UDP-N-acetylglucosamine 4,6-dehydratase (inverting) [Nitrospiraceae bacterium]
MMFNGRTVLITGGTGSFGKKFTEIVLATFKPKKLIIFSRDELKQFDMAKKFPPERYPIRYFLGDIRDRQRLYRAFEGVDYVVHAAALKQVPALEYNPFEAVKTNIIGAENIVDAAIDRQVEKVVVLSTDKAVNPVNLYGATKLAMEKIFIAANVYSGAQKTSFSIVRYGNVIGSRGSVIPFFANLLKKGEKTLPITDERMTRFWISLEQGVGLVIKALAEGVGGEIFVPKIPSMKITELAKALCPECACKVVGIRPGEKINETLISEDEARTTVDIGGEFVILPQFGLGKASLGKYDNSKRVGEGFVFRSDLNERFLTVGNLKELIKGMEFE